MSVLQEANLCAHFVLFWEDTVQISYFKMNTFDSHLEYDIENLSLPVLMYLSLAGTSLKL